MLILLKFKEKKVSKKKETYTQLRESFLFYKRVLSLS